MGRKRHEPEQILAKLREAEVERTSGRTGRKTDGVLATLLFTDIAESTEHVRRIGDAKWNALLDEHLLAARQRLQLRAGIHTGECEIEGNSLAGIAVRLAARIQAAAEPDEILVSLTVRDLMTGGEVGFKNSASTS